MKAIKTVLALILSAVTALSAVLAAFAYDGDGRSYMMGDINLDGKVTATDARKALRMSAKLDPVGDLPLTAYDADGSGKLTAADARIILRYAARLQNFDYGFDKDGKPNAISAFKSASYYIDAEMSVDGENGMNAKIAVDGSDLYMDIGQIEGTKITGMLITGGEAYAIGTLSSGTKTALFIPKDAMDSLGSNEELFELTKMLTDYFKNDFNDVTTVELAGSGTGYRYAYYDETGYTGYTVASNGGLISIESGAFTYVGNEPVVTKITSSIKFNTFSANVDKSYFDINNYMLLG